MFVQYFREILGKSGKNKLTVFSEPRDGWMRRWKFIHTNSVIRLIWKEYGIEAIIKKTKQNSNSKPWGQSSECSWR